MGLAVVGEVHTQLGLTTRVCAWVLPEILFNYYILALKSINSGMSLTFNHVTFLIFLEIKTFEDNRL